MSEKILKKYLGIFQNLNLANIDKFDRIVDKKIYFSDPFNEVYGLPKFKHIFKKTVKNLNKPNFKIINYLISKKICYVKWEMTFWAFGGEQKLVGLSEIFFNKNDKIYYHVDYWDSYNQFYVKLPILGKFFYYILSFVKTKF